MKMKMIEYYLYLIYTIDKNILYEMKTWKWKCMK